MSARGGAVSFDDRFNINADSAAQKLAGRHQNLPDPEAGIICNDGLGASGDNTGDQSRDKLRIPLMYTGTKKVRALPQRLLIFPDSNRCTPTHALQNAFLCIRGLSEEGNENTGTTYSRLNPHNTFHYRDLPSWPYALSGRAL